MNKVSLLGRMTRDAELRYTKDGKAIARFTIAVDRRQKDAGSDFISCTAFGKTAETIQKHIQKGERIALVGSIHTGSYDKNGQKVYTTEIWVDSFDFIEPKKKEDQDGFVPADIDEDEMPFK